jgi:hypothetical protein
VGIRIAFGANRQDVFALIMGETFRLVILGCMLGGAAALVACHLATHTVYISPEQAASLSQDNLSPAAFISYSVRYSCLASPSVPVLRPHAAPCSLILWSRYRTNSLQIVVIMGGC